MDMSFGTWNVRSLCRSGSLKTVASELVDCKFDLIGIHGGRWDRDGVRPTDGNANVDQISS
jgi:hypothetical protein